MYFYDLIMACVFVLFNIYSPMKGPSLQDGVPYGGRSIRNRKTDGDGIRGLKTLANLHNNRMDLEMIVLKGSIAWLPIWETLRRV